MTISLEDLEMTCYLVLDDESHRGPAMFIHPSGTTLHCRMSTEEDWNEGFDAYHEMTLNEEHHVGFVIENNRLMVFVDGSLIGEHTLYGKTNFRPDAYFTFGYTESFASFNGELRNVRFYNCAFGEDVMIRDMNCEGK